MPQPPRVITAPTTEAISSAELKPWCGLSADDDTFDTILDLCRTAAREWYETETGRTMHQTTLELALDSFSGSVILLPRATPLISPITSVKYTDSDGDESPMSSDDYIADTESEVGRLVLGYGKSWPSFTPYPSNPIKIRYAAGIATASPITQADPLDKIPILMLAAAMFDNRDAWMDSEATNPQPKWSVGLNAAISKRKLDYAF